MGDKNTSLVSYIPTVFLWVPHRAHLRMKNIALMFHAPDALHDMQIPTDAKTQVRHNMSRRTFLNLHLFQPSMKNSV
jgi:hypothetical protein